MQFDVVLDEGETGVWIAEVPSLPRRHKQGETREEALEKNTDAINLFLEVEGKVPPQPPAAIERVTVEA